VQSQKLSNPLLIWEKLLPNYNELYTVDAWRTTMRNVSWESSSTIDALLPKFKEARTKSSEFYQRFDYSWTLDRDSYEYQNEVLYQYLALTALKGLWYSAPEKQLGNPLFDNVCLRLIDRRGIRNNSPCLIRPCAGWNFIRTTYAWFEFSAIACDAFCLSVDEHINIEGFDRSQHAIDLPIIKPLWDSMIINGFVGWSECHELLRSELAQQLAYEYSTSTIRATNTEPNKPTDRLNEFSLRFTMAHELGHHLEEVFVNVGDFHTELLADYLALISLNSQNWGELKGVYAPLLNDAANVPIVAGHVFYFVLGLWVTTENVVGLCFDEPEPVRSKRATDYSKRINNWRRILNHADFKLASPLDTFFNSLLDHIVEFEYYARTVAPEMKNRFDALDRDIISTYSQINSIDDIAFLIQKQA